MGEFRWIIFSLFLMLLFSFTDAAAGRFAVRVGDDVTLSCGNLIDDQETCGDASWLFHDSEHTVTLVDRGQIHREAETESDRLSVTENCSLVIKEVKGQDVGLYTCRQIRSGQSQNTHVYLSAVTMTEHEDAGRVTLTCSVSARGSCRHAVTWLYEDERVNEDMETSESECSAAVTSLTSEDRELFKCEVTHLFTKQVQQFNFSRQSSGGQTGWWRFIVVSASLSALLISVATVNIWTRTEGNETRTDGNRKHDDEDEDEGTVKYENVGEPSVSVRLH